MADTKLTGLSAFTPARTDLLYGVDDPGGTPASGKLTIADVLGLVEEGDLPLGTDFKTVFNSTGSTITEGTLVHITGSAGGVPLVTVADKDSDAEVSGLTIEDISTGTSGTIQTGGTIQETFINTNGLTAGDPLYLGDTGAFTDTKPTSGNIIQIGVVGVVAPSNGSLLLNMPATAPELADDLSPQLGGELDAQGEVIGGFIGKVVTGVSGTLTTASHSGNLLITSGNVTVPTTTGFTCQIEAGGAHTVTFNSTTSAAMAAGDVMSIVVTSGTTIRASLLAAADQVSFT